MHFIPIHKHTFYRDKYGYKNEEYVTSNAIFKTSLSLPIYPDMKDEEVKYVIDQVVKVVNNHNK